MEENKDQEQTTPIIDQVKEYLETYIKLARYRAIERGSTIIGGIVTDLVLVVVAILVFLFASITLGLFLAEVLNSFWKGFGVLTLFYIFIIIIVMAFKKQLARPIVNGIIRRLFK